MFAIKSREDELRKLIELANDEALAKDIQTHLVRFGTVLICGHIERAVEIIITTRLQHRAHPRVLSFVKTHFQRGKKMDCEGIGQLLNRFDATWYRKFHDFVDANQDVKEGISSCYAVRNVVAHGGTYSLGPRRLTEMLDVGTRLIGAVIVATVDNR